MTPDQKNPRRCLLGQGGQGGQGNLEVGLGVTSLFRLQRTHRPRTRALAELQNAPDRLTALTTPKTVGNASGTVRNAEPACLDHP